MAIAYVGEIATATKDPASGNTTTITVGASGVTAGNHIIVVGALSGTSVITSATDTGGNTYTVDRTHSSAGTASVSVCSAHVTTGLVNGNTITITHSGASVNAFLAEEFSGVASSSYVDGVASAGAGPGSTAINTGSTAALADTTELQVCAVCRDGVNTLTLTDTTGGMSNFTTEKLSTPTTVRTVHGRYKIGVGTTAVSYVGTLSGTGRTHNEATVTYKEAGAVSATVNAVIADAVGRADLPTPELGIAVPVALAAGDAPDTVFVDLSQTRPFINLTIGA